MRTSSLRALAMQVVGPVGQPQWRMAAWLAAMLGAILAVSAGLGHAKLGGTVALAFLLTAVPTLPRQLRDGIEVIAVRGITVLCGALLVVFTDGVPTARAIAIVGLAMFGAYVDKIGPTAGLAVILPTIDLGHASLNPGLALMKLWPFAAGTAAVAVAWWGWWASSRLSERGRNPAKRVKPSDGPHGHALRVGVAVAAALVTVHLLPATLPGTHWLITSVLLTIQPQPHQTRLRIAQRLSGNTLGAIIAAAALSAEPPAPVVIAAITFLFGFATALRTVNYTWWAVMGPPALLMISEYPGLFPWYEGGVRLAMNLAGSAIVVLIVFGSSMLWSRRVTDGGTDARTKPKGSDLT